jgi:hypothetical protein
MPPGAPLEAYEVFVDQNCSFEIDGGGRLIPKDKATGARWVSHDFTGSFTATNVPHHSQTQHMFVFFAGSYAHAPYFESFVHRAGGE